MAGAKLKVTIDGHVLEVDPGTTILEAARLIGGDVVPPAMCYYSSLENTGGKCRTCIVKVTKGSDKDPRPMPKLVVSCKTVVMDGMEVQNRHSQEVLDARKGVVEMLLINHPLDCPICDQAGECKLQDLSYEHGLGNTRYDFERREFDNIDLGDKIQLHMTRCILCYRCVYVANQLTPKRVHGILERGDKSEISTYIKQSIDNEFSGNMIDVCPVGALTDKTFRFKQRVWFTEPKLAHRNCSKCCGKVIIWLKGQELVRVTARRNDYNEVTEYICNECRFDNKDLSLWVIEGPAKINRTSVISANHSNIDTSPVLKKYQQRIESVK